jgi:hypothetical protein
MVTHIFESFSLLKPAVAPDGSILIQFWETSEDGHATGQKYVLPIARENLEEYYNLLGELLNKAKVDVASMQDLQKEVAHQDGRVPPRAR